MPKLDLSKIQRIKNSTGNISAVNFGGAIWKPSNTPLVFLGTQAVTSPSGIFIGSPVTVDTSSVLLSKGHLGDNVPLQNGDLVILVHGLSTTGTKDLHNAVWPTGHLVPHVYSNDNYDTYLNVWYGILNNQTTIGISKLGSPADGEGFVIAAYRGFDPNQPFDVIPASSTTRTSSGSAPAIYVTPEIDGSEVLSVAATATTTSIGGSYQLSTSSWGTYGRVNSMSGTTGRVNIGVDSKKWNTGDGVEGRPWNNTSTTSNSQKSTVAAAIVIRKKTA